jgi:hypothetical protein
LSLNGFTHVSPAETLQGDDDTETAELKAMHGEARAYLESFRWCPKIARSFFGAGLTGVVAVFLFEFVELVHGTDKWLWVVVGDLPTVHLVTDKAKDPYSALEVYCEVMDDWVDAVKTGVGLSKVFPVKVPADAKHAEMLATRLELLREEIIPLLRSEPEPD